MNAELGVPLVPFVADREKVDNTHDAAKGSVTSLSNAFERMKKVWKRFGPFWQDSVSQITYIVPQFIAYQMAKAESCNSETTQSYEGKWPFTYESAVGTRTVEFDSNQLYSACGVRYQSISTPMNLLLSVMVLQQLVFVVINILKASRRVT